jgi:hypothetical protein
MAFIWIRAACEEMPRAGADGGPATLVIGACSVFAGVGTDERQEDEAMRVAANESQSPSRHRRRRRQVLSRPILSG